MDTPRARARFFLTFLSIILFASVPVMGQRLHPKLKEAKPGGEKPVINRLVILPAEISLSKDGMKGDQPLEKEAVAATPIIEKAMAKALTNKNLTVLDSPFSPEALQNDEKLRYAMADLRRNYDELNGKMIKKQKDVEKGRFSLGDQVLLLNPDDSIDAFVFITATGKRKTGGMKALGIATLNPFMLIPLYFINVGIVDARTGDVLAYTSQTTTLDIGKEDDKKLVNVLTKILRKFPDGKPAEKRVPAETPAEER